MVFSFWVKVALWGGMWPGGASLLTLVCHSCWGGGRHFHSTPKHLQGLKTQHFFIGTYIHAFLLLFLFYDFWFLRPLLLGPLFSHGKYFDPSSFLTLFSTHILLQFLQSDKLNSPKSLISQWRPLRTIFLTFQKTWFFLFEWKMRS